MTWSVSFHLPQQLDDFKDFYPLCSFVFPAFFHDFNKLSFIIAPCSISWVDVWFYSSQDHFLNAYSRRKMVSPTKDTLLKHHDYVTAMIRSVTYLRLFSIRNVIVWPQTSQKRVDVLTKRIYVDPFVQYPTSKLLRRPILHSKKDRC